MTVRDGYLLLGCRPRSACCCWDGAFAAGKGVRCGGGSGDRPVLRAGCPDALHAGRNHPDSGTPDDVGGGADRTDGRAGAVITGNDDGSNLVMLLRERGIRALDFLVVTDGTEGDLARLPSPLEAYIADTVYLYPAGRGPARRSRRSSAVPIRSKTPPVPFGRGDPPVAGWFPKNGVWGYPVLFCSGEGMPRGFRRAGGRRIWSFQRGAAPARRGDPGHFRRDGLPGGQDADGPQGHSRSDYEIRATQREQSDLALMTRGRGDMTWKS